MGKALPLLERSCMFLLSRSRTCVSRQPLLRLSTGAAQRSQDSRVRDGPGPETTHEPGFKQESVAELFRRSATFDSDRPKDVHDLWSSATYPVNFKLPEEKEEEESIRIDPKNTSVVLFPGQAIENCVAAAGFSVGEYAALVFSQALSFEDAVRLVKIRGEAMQAASELVPGGLMTVFLATTARASYICKLAREWCYRQGYEDAVCSVANYLFPHCKVIGGSEEALQFVELNARDLGIKRYKRLSVSGAFHTPLMRPAQKPLARALQAVHLAPPRIMTHSNLDGAAYSHPEEIRRKLEAQLVMPVKWEQLMQQVYNRDVGEEFPRTFECGPGTSLRAVLKMVNGKAWNVSESIGA
ncbi:hypothetical protein HPB47_026729 [Ixodes persulcatus]|uniref:Uncharacterized protein n=1 Tax=Ixodes persulcatus TaxID=34615 RepID=A0AC60PY26_IXOPE|nr:hypothetical protein HPB47_026729 [Ixodes persulcatus]